MDAALSGTAQAVIGAVAGDVAALVTTEALKDGAADPLSITQISDECNVFKTILLT